MFVSHRFARVAAGAALLFSALVPGAAFAAQPDNCTVQGTGFSVYVVEVNASGSSSGEGVAGAVCSYLDGSGYFHGVSKYTRIPAGSAWVCNFSEISGDYANIYSSQSDRYLAEAFCQGIQSAAPGDVTWYPTGSR